MQSQLLKDPHGSSTDESSVTQAQKTLLNPLVTQAKCLLNPWEKCPSVTQGPQAKCLLNPLVTQCLLNTQAKCPSVTQAKYLLNPLVTQAKCLLNPLVTHKTLLNRPRRLPWKTPLVTQKTPGLTK